MARRNPQFRIKTFRAEARINGEVVRTVCRQLVLVEQTNGKKRAGRRSKPGARVARSTRRRSTRGRATSG